MALYAFDGTWQSVDDNASNDTNVALFHRAYERGSGDDEFYTPGVGTRFGKFGKVLGGATGIGGVSHLLEASAVLQQQWQEGDHDIDIVGFSRGAALALSFANTHTKFGSVAGIRTSAVARTGR